MDYVDGEGRGDPAGGNVPQDRTACLGRPPLKAPRGPPTDSAQSRGLWRQATGNGAGGHHRRDRGYSGAVTVRVGGARGETPSACSTGCCGLG